MKTPSFQRVGWAVVYAMGGAVVVLVIVTIGLIRSSQVNRAPTIDNTAKAAHAAEAGTQRIEDCTTPGRPCFDRGQKQLARTVAGLVQSNQQAAAAAAACAANLPVVTFRTVYACELRALAEHKR